MAEVTKLLYIVVVDDGEKTEEGKDSFRYTRPVLQCTLQLMGCKPRHSFKISKRVFEVIRGSSADSSPSVGVGMTGSLAAGPAMKVNDNTTGRGSLAAGPAMKVNDNTTGSCSGVADTSKNLVSGDNSRNENIPFESYKRRTTVTVGRENFLDVVCDALAEYKYMGPNQREDLVLACRIRERKESVTVLLCGTSGCGKSTLSSLLGSRLGITTVLSTDSIRHMMRSFADEKQNPLLWASTYHAGECLDPVAVAEAKARRKANKLAGVSCSLARDEAVHGYTVRSDGQSSRVASVAEPLSPRRMAVEGFKAQSEMVIDSLDRLITAWEERKESVVVEGVHLSLNFVMGLMKKHPSIIPFMIYISNEEKHLERFAVRAKYMTLDPAKNKYVKYIRNIRTIQEYLCKRADKHLVPKINNTNVDRSVAAIHATVFGCLRRRDAGEQLYDPATNTVSVIDEEYRHRCAANSMSSKGMLQLIQRKGSTRHLMALLNTDGSVAKAWPVDSGTINDDCGGDDGVIGHPVYGPLLMGKAERVNLQFGHFGISAWPGDTGGTSYASSADGSRTEGTESSSRHHSPCSSSSPRMSDGHDKELKEEQSVSGSDEEVDDLAEVDSDEDVSYGSERQMDEEVEGSVDESTKSDEEYDDLAMEDVQEDGYSFDEGCSRDEMVPCFEGRHIHGEDGDAVMRDKYKENLERFLQAVGGAMPEPPPCSYSSLVVVGSECELAESGDDRTDKRSLSIPLVLGKRGPLISILSGAPLR